MLIIKQRTEVVLRIKARSVQGEGQAKVLIEA